MTAPYVLVVGRLSEPEAFEKDCAARIQAGMVPAGGVACVNCGSDVGIAQAFFTPIPELARKIPESSS